MSERIIFRIGEATVLAKEGQFTDAMPEVLVGDVSGPAGHAFAGMMGQTAGHTRLFAIRALQPVGRPGTIMVPSHPRRADDKPVDCQPALDKARHV